MSWRFTVAALGLMLGVASSVSAATLTVENGILMGATNVDVNGTLYDVSFVEGSCISLFSGCDANSDFTFPTYQSADRATRALLTQVFIDVPGLGNFNSNPSLTFGCGGGSSCDVMIPYVVLGNSVNVFAARNEAASNSVMLMAFNTWIDSRTDPSATFARWSLSPPPSTVPEPTSLTLLGLGLIGAGASRWRRQRA